MDTDRPQHRSTSNGSSATSTSELFICFTSRLSSSSSMKITSKSILSPGRARDSSQISLSTSLSRRLRSSGSIKGGQASPMFPPTNGKKRGCSFENPEPSSPKVTCIGQVRVKTKKQGKKIRAARSKSRREVSFRRTEQGSSTSNLQDATHFQDYGQMGHTFQQQECLPHTHRNQRWVHLPVTICEALRAFGAEFNCFLPCRSSCMASSSQREKEDKPISGGNHDNNGGGSSSSCGAVFARWLMAEKIELVVGEDEEEEQDEMPRRSQRRHVFEDIVIGDAEKFGDNNKTEILEEEEARVSICIPPKNALLLMRCRSDPVKMAALANRFWECPPPQDEADYEKENQNENEQVNGEHESLNESHQGKDDSQMEVQQQTEQTEQVLSCDNLVSVNVTEEDKVPEVKTEALVFDREEEEQESQEIIQVEEGSSEKQEQDHENVEVGLEASPDPENEGNAVQLLQENENEVILEDEDGDEDEPQPEQPQAEETKDVIFDAIEESRPRLSTSSVVSVQPEQEYHEELGQEQEAIPAEESAEEKETLEKILQEVEEGEVTVATTRERPEPDDPDVTQEPETGQESKESGSQNHQQQQQNLLPDCLLLMMCEPKLSMEVSKETWVCSTDFIRWQPPERKPACQIVNKSNHSDEPKKRVSIDSNPAQQQQQQQMQQQQQLMQPPRSSCSFPLAPPLPPAHGAASMNSMVEQKLVGTKPSYEPFVLTRCKSEPMRSSTKLATEACFWKNRKLEPHRPATLGVGAAGVGF